MQWLFRSAFRLTLLLGFVHSVLTMALFHLVPPAQLLAAEAYFPFRFYFAFEAWLKRPGYDDIQFGTCYFPHCEKLALLLAVLVSLGVYYALARLIRRVVKRRSVDKGMQ